MKTNGGLGIAEKNFIILLIGMCFLNITIYAQRQKWLGELLRVKPLVTTQSEIEKVTGQKGKRFTGRADWYYYLVEYKTKYGYWNVKYSTNKCSQEKDE